MSHSALVTGGAKGIGRAIVQRLVRDGWRVVAIDVDPSVESVAAGVGAHGLIGDVRSYDQLCLAVEAAEELAPVGALVNNAAIVDLRRAGFEDISETEWEAVLAVNVIGVWKAIKAVAPAMRRSGSGAVVNISSDTVFSGVSGLSHYLASKGAVNSMTRGLATELGAENVRVNTVALGFTETAAALSHGSEAQKRSVSRRPISRPQTPSDAVGTVSWLVSVDAQFVTGQTVVVNGGYVFN